MPYRRKDSAVWWAPYVDASGQRVRRATGTTERKEAQTLESKWKLEAFRTEQWGEIPSRTFAVLMVPYLKATLTEKRSEAQRGTAISSRGFANVFAPKIFER